MNIAEFSTRRRVTVTIPEWVQIFHRVVQAVAAHAGQVGIQRDAGTVFHHIHGRQQGRTLVARLTRGGAGITGLGQRIHRQLLGSNAVDEGLIAR